MSHVEERKEKNCLNCGAIVQGRFCHICGQENTVPHETFWHMVKHFFYDITHFDSNFFDSVKYLVQRPGFLSKEYMAGRRVSYLNPIKMYVFTSAVFFLIFFSLFHVSEDNFSVPDNSNFIKNLKDNKEKVLANMHSKEDSLAAIKFYTLFDKENDVKKKDTIKRKGDFNFTFDERLEKYRTVVQYDSAQKVLPASERDGWFTRLLSRKVISLNERYQGEQAKLGSALLNKFMHSFPYILFVSLPLYALFLKLLYIRNKKFYFADHGIFLIHLYIFTFLLMLAFIVLGEMGDAFSWDWLGWVQAAVVFYGVWYAYKAMRNFYGQSRAKTTVKFILFNIICFLSILILFAAFLLVTFFQV
ncbi:MAG: DUF3667 domain-containing protein [Chitinophagaceae bacterium]|nr:MAG: DUF3667 domain-containing protein [Chitinophagaceae bacterium]